jgi:hypothetical protein
MKVLVTCAVAALALTVTAIARAEAYFDSGDLKRDLARRVAMPTESQNPARAPVLVEYLETEMKPALEKLGFKTQLLHEGKWPFLFAERQEEGAETTVSATAMATSSAASTTAGRRGSRPGGSPSAATAGMGAASSTTRASTRSTSARSRRS